MKASLTIAGLAVLATAAAPGFVAAEGEPKVGESTHAPPFAPDLVITNYVFGSDKVVRVRIDNIGNAPANANTLRLTVRVIKEIKVARKIDEPVPAIPPGGHVWVSD